MSEFSPSETTKRGTRTRPLIKLGAGFVVRHHIVDPDDPAIIRPKQVHGGTIVKASELGNKPKVKRILARDPLAPPKEEEDGADGVVITTQDQAPAAITTADCVPLVLAGDDTAVLLHVSRKSIIRNLVYNAKKYLPPTHIKHVYIGPHICRKHFTFEHMGKELNEFCCQFPAACDTRDQLIHISLRHALQQYFKAWDVTPDKIIEDGRCTYEDESLPSYRRSLGRDEPLTKHLATILTPA